MPTEGPTRSSAFPITSAQNPRIKHLGRLMTESRLRRESQTFVVEGAREIKRALASGFKPLGCYMCPSLHGPDALDTLEAFDQVAKGSAFDQARSSGGEESPVFFEITPSLFEKIALRRDKDGLLVVFKARTPVGGADFALEAARIPGSPLVLALQGVEKPGNLGAIIRSADAFGVDAVLIVSESPPDAVDLYHPHLVRNSLGAVFAKPFGVLSSTDLVKFCQTHGLRLMGAALHPQSQNLYQSDLTGPLAILMGSESLGIDPDLQNRCHGLVQIPMFGLCDSLNVSTATAVILSETVRQRSCEK